MKAGLKKKDEKQNRELIHKLLDLVLDINGLEPRQQNCTGNLPSVFFEFSGHTACIDVSTHDNGWYSSAKVDKRVGGHTYQTQELKAAICKLEAIKAETPTAGTVGESR